MRFMIIMIPGVYSKPVPPDFMPDMEAVKQMENTMRICRGQASCWRWTG